VKSIRPELEILPVFRIALLVFCFIENGCADYSGIQISKRGRAMDYRKFLMEKLHFKWPYPVRYEEETREECDVLVIGLSVK